MRDDLDHSTDTDRTSSADRLAPAPVQQETDGDAPAKKPRGKRARAKKYRPQQPGRKPTEAKPAQAEASKTAPPRTEPSAAEPPSATADTQTSGAPEQAASANASAPELSAANTRAADGALEPPRDARAQIQALAEHAAARETGAETQERGAQPAAAAPTTAPPETASPKAAPQKAAVKPRGAAARKNARAGSRSASDASPKAPAERTPAPQAPAETQAPVAPPAAQARVGAKRDASPEAPTAAQTAQDGANAALNTSEAAPSAEPEARAEPAETSEIVRNDKEAPPAAADAAKGDGDDEKTEQDAENRDAPVVSDQGAGAGAPPPPPKAARRIFDDGESDFRVTLARAVAEARSQLVAVGIFSFVINMLILAIPIYLFQVSDRVLTSRSTETLVMLTVVVVGALALYAILDVIRRHLLMRVAVRFETTVSAPVLSAAAKSAQHGSSREFQALGDLAQIRNFMTGPTLLTMFDAPVAPIYFLAVFLVHWELGVIVTIAALILLAIALINQRITAVPFSRANAFNMRASYQAEAMARSGETVNAMGMIPEGVIVWGREMAEALKAQIEAQDRNVVMAGISKFFRLITQVAMLGWGAYLTLEGELTGGMMIAASIIASRALAPVEGLIEGWRSYVGARGAFARVKTLLSASPLNVDRLQLPRPQGRLHVERLLYVPPPTKKIILNGVDFTLNPGESLAIVGPSGTGKSTLAKMLVGSLTPTSGSVRLDLMDIRNWDPRQFGETVGYLPQEVQLFPTTIKSNISRLREDVSDASIFDAAELAGVHELISQMPQGYETLVNLDGSPLSGGQKQRIGLARAFFGDPRLVVLDEPNSNLDSAGELALAGALHRARERGITVIAVTQRPSLLRSVEKILVMNEGRVQAIGPRDDILPILKGQLANPSQQRIEAAE